MRNLHCTAARRRRGSGVASALCAAFLLAVALATHAEINERLDYTDYPVQGAHRGSLGPALDENSPIHYAGTTYHAYTTWLVSWRYSWRTQPDGNCRIDQVAIDLHSTITLPRLEGGSPQLRERFERYLGALREHELGHHQIGRQAAQAIQQELQAMPPMADCRRLTAAANKLASRTIARFRNEERTYDLISEHGRQQGARLDYDY